MTIPPDKISEAIEAAKQALNDKHRPPVAGLAVIGKETLQTLILAATTPAAEVTVEEFNDMIDPQMPSFNNIGNLFLNKFPNGIRIVADKK